MDCVVLSVPVQGGGLRINTTNSMIIEPALTYIRREFPSAAIRHKVIVKDELRSAQFYRLDGHDIVAADLIMQYLTNNEYRLLSASLIDGAQVLPYVSYCFART